MLTERVEGFAEDHAGGSAAAALLRHTVQQHCRTSDDQAVFNSSYVTFNT